MKKIMLLLFFICCFASLAFAGHQNPEKYYTDIGCKKLNGISNYFVDGVYIDCVTATEAIEFEFPEKWAEGVGQALHYGYIMKKTPTIVFIVETKDELKYIYRAMPILFKHGIKFYTMSHLEIGIDALIIPQTIPKIPFE
jgi:hypothetical protein